MSQRAKLTSKGQITIPVAVRQALELREGDHVLFEVDERKHTAVVRVRRSGDLLSMAGAVPPRKALPKTWSDERRIAREEALRKRQ